MQVHAHDVEEAAPTGRPIEASGISEADQKKLFQKFTRLSARPTGGESSTGLGLAIVKRLAEAMSGTIQCHSVPGTGATFMLRLPVWPKELSEPNPSSAIRERRHVALPKPLPRCSARN
jgi:light-regulated signal transduction histidine kinase (bacteriophytochrome)